MHNHQPQVVAMAPFSRGLHTLKVQKPFKQDRTAREMPNSHKNGNQRNSPIKNQNSTGNTNPTSIPSTRTPHARYKSAQMQRQHNPAPAPHTRLMRAHNTTIITGTWGSTTYAPQQFIRTVKRKLIHNRPASLAKLLPKTTCTSCAAAKLQPARHQRRHHNYSTG